MAIWIPRKNRPRPPFGAFLLDRVGDLRWVERGAAAPIDFAIRDLIQAANDWSTSLGSHEKQAVESAQTTANDAIATLGQENSDAVESLVRSGETARRLRIGPDGMLTLLPFGALSNGRFRDQRYAVSYLPGFGFIGTFNSEVGPPVTALSPGAGGRRPLPAMLSQACFAPIGWRD